MRFSIAFASLLAVVPIALAAPAVDVPFTLIEVGASNSTSDAEGIIEARQVNPTMLFYAGTGCASGGYRYSLVDRPFGVCQSQIPPSYLSFKIDNPSGSYLPYTVWVGTCAAPIQVPHTNTCYNINPAGTGWLRQSTGGGTF
ncbi:hypothetical protein BDN72DRAFT_849595 [Pluteus cervinus]|uniref:Uncharacterized protein n=1 Tax=Pluteus cervinus TaxID=181527 RepID=A0ACD3A6P7_9AGAR|nr:hypothetical protein BDN72DRAFT_849595 [Pluteus cervinus]